MSDSNSFFENLMGNCSPYWGANTLLSFINGRKSRREKEADAISDKEFHDWVLNQKYSYEDQKEVLELDFKRRMKEIQRENSLIQKELELNFDSQKDQLRMFVKGWPLKQSLTATQQLRETQIQLPTSLYVVIASHTGHKSIHEDMLTKLYEGNGNIVDHVSSQLRILGIPSENILRFIRGNKPGGGAALANIFSMMSQMPTVVILPRLDSLNKKLRLSVGFWSPCASIPSQRIVFLLDYDENRMETIAKYKESKQREIEMAYICLAGVMNDMYRFGTFGILPTFLKYIKSSSLLEEFPHIADFVRREYLNVINKPEAMMFVDGYEYKLQNQRLNEDLGTLILSEFGE